MAGCYFNDGGAIIIEGRIIFSPVGGFLPVKSRQGRFFMTFIRPRGDILLVMLARSWES